MARSFSGKLVIGLIGVYRAAISPLIGPRCRYVPTCSEYASQAIERHGLCCGVRLALGRIFRCHPWGGSGLDEVPEQVNPRCCTSFSLTPRTRKFH